MNRLIVFVSCILLFFNSNQAQSRLDLRNSRIENATLVEILNYAEMQNLNKLSDKSKSSELDLRLYSVGVEGSCIPDTHGICSYKYYLAVAEQGVGLTQAVFFLGEVGEITKVQWLESSQPYLARLQLEISNYSNYGFELNTELVRKTRTLELNVSTRSIKITAKK